ncbi:hypothetical protein Tco_0394199 [Tanacetum coccineum]
MLGYSSKEYSLALRGSVDVGRDNLNFKFKYHMWDEDVKDNKDKGAYVGNEGDKKYNKVQSVRECEWSCRRIRFGEGLSEEGLGFVVMRKGDEDDN